VPTPRPFRVESLVATIVVDAGHGTLKPEGYDPGACAVHGTRFLREADIALAYALTLKYVLARDGFHIRMTRSTETTTMGLSARAQLLNDADALISIHLNASPNFAARGFETLYRHDSQFPFAKAMHGALQEAFGIYLPDRGIKQRKLAVLRIPKPAALLELGFITNRTDVEFIHPANAEHARETRLRFANAVSKALRRFFNAEVIP